MLMSPWITCAFWTLALIASIFFGLKAFDLFGVSTKGRTGAWLVHQFWLNFLGSAFGWTAGWFIIRKVWLSLDATGPMDFGWLDAVWIAVAFVGMTGYLPYVVVSVLADIKGLVLKIIKLGK